VLKKCTNFRTLYVQIHLEYALRQTGCKRSLPARHPCANRGIIICLTYTPAPGRVGRYAASYGVSFVGTPQHTFKYISPAESGLFVKGEVRDIREVNTIKGKYIAIARNNDSLQIFLKK
jgi:hypothetical protein